MKTHHKWRETIQEKILSRNPLPVQIRDEKSLAAQAPATPGLISFYCAAPRAQSVELIGDFNQGEALPMQRSADGWWYARLFLDRGCYQYRYRIDGRPALAPHAARLVRNKLNEPMCLVVVG